MEPVIFPFTKLSDGFFTPSPGKKYAVAEVRECGGPNYSTDNSGCGLNTTDWALDGPGVTEVWDPVTQKDPALDKVNADNLTNRCATGWLTFEFPQKKTPTWIRYTGQFGSTFSWELIKRKRKG